MQPSSLSTYQLFFLVFFPSKFKTMGHTTNIQVEGPQRFKIEYYNILRRVYDHLYLK